ncbi:MAG: sulfurtransferase [Candidatus Eiseniibacteriota bacterium]
MNVPLLVSTEWLAGRLDDSGIWIADVRWSLLEKDKGRNAYLEGHIPGAVFLDVDHDLASPRGEGPGRHPLPRAESFAASMSRAGIGADAHVVAYDFGDGSTAARLWWLLRYFGHERVSLLDGGFARWVLEGRPLETEAPSYGPTAFTAEPNPSMRVGAADVERLRIDPRALVLDSRMAERYEGKVELIDPVAGHIPGAKSRPYPANVRSTEDPRFFEPAKLHEQFAQLGADRAQHVVAYCGSGVNACQNLFALELAGFDAGLLYEGSWSDWCSVPSRAMAKGREPDGGMDT